MKGFSEEIADHLFRGTTLNREISNVKAVGDETETEIEMLAALVLPDLRPLFSRKIALWLSCQRMVSW